MTIANILKGCKVMYVPLKANNSCEMCYSGTDCHGKKCLLCKSTLTIKVPKNPRVFIIFC